MSARSVQTLLFWSVKTERKQTIYTTSQLMRKEIDEVPRWEPRSSTKFDEVKEVPRWEPRSSTKFDERDEVPRREPQSSAKFDEINEVLRREPWSRTSLRQSRDKPTVSHQTIKARKRFITYDHLFLKEKKNTYIRALRSRVWSLSLHGSDLMLILVHCAKLVKSFNSNGYKQTDKTNENTTPWIRLQRNVWHPGITDYAALHLLVYIND